MSEPAPPGALRHRARRDRPRRGAVIAAILVLVMAGALADRSASPRPAAATPVPDQPVAASTGALSSVWFCAGASAEAGAASGSLLVANPTSFSRTATVTILASNGTPVPPQRFVVGPRSRLQVAEKVKGGAPWVGATVHLDGGGVAVEQQLSGPLGAAATPCATRGSANWYFPTGTTLRNASDVVSLLNPFPTDALVDLSFVTNQGGESPIADQAIGVPADSIVAVDLGSHLRRRSTIATTVTARTGKVVAWQTEMVTPPAAGTPILGEPAPPGYSGPLDPAPPVGGVELTLGAPSGSGAWWWPDGVAGGGVNEQYVVYNPGSRAAQLRLTFGLNRGGEQPLGFIVAPGSVKSIATSAQPQVPAGAPHDASLVSTNGVPVVAERTVTAVSPSPRTGLAGLLGSTISATRWLLGASGTSGSHLDEWLEVQNPGRAPVTMSILEVGAGGPSPLRGVPALTVPAGGRVATDVSARAKGAISGPLLVQATGPVITERDLYGAGAPGIALAIGVPLP